MESSFSPSALATPPPPPSSSSSALQESFLSFLTMEENNQKTGYNDDSFNSKSWDIIDDDDSDDGDGYDFLGDTSTTIPVTTSSEGNIMMNQQVTDRDPLLSSVMEPTPIIDGGVCTTHGSRLVVVSQVPLTSVPWLTDSSYYDALRSLLSNIKNDGMGDARTGVMSNSAIVSLDTSTKTSGCHTRRRVVDDDGTSSIASSLTASVPETNNINDDDTAGNAVLDEYFSGRDGGEDSSTARATSPSTTDGKKGSSSFRSSHMEQWNARYQDMVEFRQRHGHCLVPLNHAENPSLAHWVKRQRYQYSLKLFGKHSTLTEERQAMLELLNFIWDSHGAQWEERYQELIQFVRYYGHPNVPTKYPKNPKLSIWVKCQRRQYKLYHQRGPQHSNITPERIERLSQIGFAFDPRHSRRKHQSLPSKAAAGTIAPIP